MYSAFFFATAGGGANSEWHKKAVNKFMIL